MRSVKRRVRCSPLPAGGTSEVEITIKAAPPGTRVETKPATGGPDISTRLEYRRPNRSNKTHAGKPRGSAADPGTPILSRSRAPLAVLPMLVCHWLPSGAREDTEWVARNPRRADRRPGSFKVNLRTGRWADFATGDRGGDIVSLAAYLSGRSQWEACRRLAAALGVPYGR